MFAPAIFCVCVCLISFILYLQVGDNGVLPHYSMRGVRIASAVHALILPCGIFIFEPLVINHLKFYTYKKSIDSLPILNQIIDEWYKQRKWQSDPNDISNRKSFLISPKTIKYIDVWSFSLPSHWKMKTSAKIFYHRWFWRFICLPNFWQFTQQTTLYNNPLFGFWCAKNQSSHISQIPY